MRATPLVTVCLLALAVAGCEPEEGVVMPDVVGIPLDQARTAIRDAGFTGRVSIDGTGVFGAADESGWQVCYQMPAAGSQATIGTVLEVDRSCDDEGEGLPTTFEEASPPPPTLRVIYRGPDYEIAAIDGQAVSLDVDQYWVLTGELDYSTPDYQDQIKLLIADVILNAGNAQLVIQVVTDPEIIEAESTATSNYYMESMEPGYWEDVMVPKEASDWVAWYTGGFDYDTGELTYADGTYMVDWWPAGDIESELWKPEIAD